MKRSIIFLVIAIMLQAGCKKGKPEYVPSRAVYILNGLAETISIYDIQDDTMANDVISTGATPNDILIIGDTGYIVNSGFGGTPSLQIIDLESNKEVMEIPLPVGTNPWSVCVVNNNAYITLWAVDSVLVIDLATCDRVTAIKVGTAPAGIIYYNGKIYVANTGFTWGKGYEPGTISIIENEQVIKTIGVGINPQNIGIDSSGILHVVCTGNYVDKQGVVYLIKADQVIDSIKIGGNPASIAITRQKVYLGDYSLGLLSYDATNYTIIHGATNPIKVGNGTMGLAIDSEARLYVCNFSDDEVVIVDTETDSLIKKLSLGADHGPQDVAIR